MESWGYESEGYIKKRKKAKDGAFPLNRIPSPPKIDKGIPIPVEARGGARNIYRFYPFERMKIGDSFWLPLGPGCDKLSSAVSKFSKKSNWKFIKRGVTRTGKENKTVSGLKRGMNGRGVRVWRIK